MNVRDILKCTYIRIREPSGGANENYFSQQNLQFISTCGRVTGIVECVFDIITT